MKKRKRDQQYLPKIQSAELHEALILGEGLLKRFFQITIKMEKILLRYHLNPAANHL